MTTYQFKDKSQVNVRLSHFLLNGIDILGAKLGMSRSEILRLATYIFIKEHFTKQEMDVLASINDEYEHEWCEKTVIILSAILQDD
jgi:metal-responsive CopG/Arc/MetJ family transcriptional regulator